MSKVFLASSSVLTNLLKLCSDGKKIGETKTLDPPLPPWLLLPLPLPLLLVGGVTGTLGLCPPSLGLCPPSLWLLEEAFTNASNQVIYPDNNSIR